MNPKTETLEEQPHKLDPGANFVKNQKQLAEVLGVSRQLIAYHSNLPSSPRKRDDGRYEVPAWRRYLKDASRARLAKRQHYRLTFFDGVEAAHAKISEALPRALSEALRLAGIESAPEATARAEELLFLMQSAQLDEVLLAWDGESLLAGDETGEDKFPAAIKADANLISLNASTN